MIWTVKDIIIATTELFEIHQYNYHALINFQHAGSMQW